jgi:hypothetical protein
MNNNEKNFLDQAMSKITILIILKQNNDINVKFLKFQSMTKFRR